MRWNARELLGHSWIKEKIAARIKHEQDLKMIRADFVQRIVSNFEWFKYASPQEWALFRSMKYCQVFAEEID
jgi:hypothetical protein